MECKSYMDSTGVRVSAFDGSNAEHAKRYKLFNEPDLRRVVFNRLCLQFTECGACREGPQVRLSLACGFEAGTIFSLEFQREKAHLLSGSITKTRLSVASL